MRKFNWVLMLLMVGMTAIQSCEKDDPQPDPTPPTPVADPISCFTSVDAAYHHEDVSFNNCSENSESYAWDFGDGQTSTEESPKHAYISIGTYTVKLTATNSAGVINETTKTLTIKNKPTKMTIHEIRIIKWPATNNGTAWDAASSPDLYPKIVLNTPLTDLYTSSMVVNDATAGTTAVFGTNSGLPVTITSIDEQHSVVIYDQDPSGTDEKMGKMDFIPSYFGIGAATIIGLQNNDWQIELDVTWEV